MLPIVWIRKYSEFIRDGVLWAACPSTVSPPSRKRVTRGVPGSYGALVQTLVWAQRSCGGSRTDLIALGGSTLSSGTACPIGSCQAKVQRAPILKWGPPPRLFFVTSQTIFVLNQHGSGGWFYRLPLLVGAILF